MPAAVLPGQEAENTLMNSAFQRYQAHLSEIAEHDPAEAKRRARIETDAEIEQLRAHRRTLSCHRGHRSDHSGRRGDRRLARGAVHRTGLGWRIRGHDGGGLLQASQYTNDIRQAEIR